MAYAAVISLKHTIERLENPINKPQITKSAYVELDSLVSMLEKLDAESSRMIDRSVINELDEKIREAVWKVEDVLESYNSLNISPSQGCSDSSEKKSKRKVLFGFFKKKSCCFVPLIDDIWIVMDSFLKTVKMLRKEYNIVLQNPLPAAEEEEDEALSAAVPEPVNESTTVGLSDLSENVINQLLQPDESDDELETCSLSGMAGSGFESDKRAVSLVGMAGIGKTHLARQIYHDPRIVQHFDVRVWVRAGPKHQLNIILADILAQIEGKPRDLFKEKSEDTLIDLLHESLLGGKYLIILDDIWTRRVMDYIRNYYLIGNGKESRFLITTRQHEVAKHESATIHQMPFLNNIDSWNLLRQNVFAEESFPPQLEKVGRKIAEKCEGLPLLILAVANILCGQDKTEEYWMKVAENKTTTFTVAYDNIYEVLLSSYEYLTQHLKPCFLYMGVFPQSFEIPLSKLINLWAVEDFLEPTLYHLYPHLQRFDEDFVLKSQQQKLEEFAIECMEDLVSKSLVIVCKQSFFKKHRKIKSSKLHSAYWYLCVKEARKSKFLHVLNKLTDVSKDYIEKQRRLSVQNNILLGLREVYDKMAAATSSTTRSLLLTGEDHQYPVRICFINMMLVKVLDALAIRFYEFPNEVLKLLELKYLSLTHNGELPSSINKLQQLQCLILRPHHNIKFPKAPTTYLPDEIWDMKELRHLRIMGSNLPDPCKSEELPKLLTLHVNAHSCTEAVFRSFPKLKKLGIRIELEPDAAAETIKCLEHIGLLTTLKSLKCVVVNPRLQSQLAVAQPDHLSNLPRGLKKLSLNGLGYSWKYMTAIGSLPNLQVLKLRCSAFQGPHWEIEVGQFKSLEYLLLEDIDLVHWICRGCSLYNLSHLSVRHCYKLKKIPQQRLKMLEVDDCSPSVVNSAQEWKEFCLQYFDGQFVINYSWNL